MKFYRKMYAAALLCEFLQHVGRILNAYFPKGKLAEIFLTAVQCGMPHREGVRRLLYDLDFNHGSLRFRSWDILQRVAAKSAEDFPVILISLVVIVLAITAAVLIWRCHKRRQEDTVYHEDFSEEEDEHEE